MTDKSDVGTNLNSLGLSEDFFEVAKKFQSIAKINASLKPSLEALRFLESWKKQGDQFGNIVQSMQKLQQMPFFKFNEGGIANFRQWELGLALCKMDKDAINELIKHPDFNADVLLGALLKFGLTSKQVDDEIAEYEKKNNDLQGELDKRNNGSKKRQDGIDREKFQTHLKGLHQNEITEIKKVHHIQAIAKNAGIQKEYSVEVIKKWFKKVFPNHKLEPGAPKKIKNNMGFTR